ncbi:hypothetical protein ACHAWF_016946 [Thalassiosira exigua]
MTLESSKTNSGPDIFLSATVRMMTLSNVAALHVMSYLKGMYNSCLALDPPCNVIDTSKFNFDADWTAFYGDTTEALPPNAPEPRGKEVDL